MNSTSVSSQDEIFLPKPLMMTVASYLKNYDLAKLYSSCTYFSECAQA
jgi:hypothetical protein